MAGRRWFRLLVGLIATHSCLLGLLMLFVPFWLIDLFGFPSTSQRFFPSQSGIFLVILGICYFLTLKMPDFVWVIVISKALAVAFLFSHVLLLDAPDAVLAAGVGDALMLAATLLAIRRFGVAALA